MAVALLLSAMAWAQSQPVVMNLTDIYGDTQQVELKGGETIYLSQLRWGNVWQNYYGSPSGSLVMCDANGVPCYQMAMEELASITYTGAVGQTSYSLPDYTEPTLGSQNWMRWRVGGRDYTILLPGE